MNAAFLAMAVLSGLTCPIADPTEKEIKRVLLISDLLLGKDEFCRNYLRTFAEKKKKKDLKKQEKEKVIQEERADEWQALKEAVIIGQRVRATEMTRKALETGADPQDLISTALIPALNKVGERFEKKQIFVPEMMMAAKTMQACLDLLQPLMTQEETAKQGTVVLGTVAGDLHDIGKNLAKLLLESSGFKVIDLGVNVPASRFVEAGLTHQARVIGISSLLTTGDPYVEETVKAIRESDLAGKVKVVCGGAALTSRFVEEVCGADAHARDAADGIRKIRKLLGLK